MRRAALLLSLFLAVSAEAKNTRDIVIEITRPTVGDTYDIFVAPQGRTLIKAASATFLKPTIVVSRLTVGRSYDFAAIVRRGTISSVRPPPLHYTITRANNQKLLGVAPP